LEHVDVPFVTVSHAVLKLEHGAEIGRLMQFEWHLLSYVAVQVLRQQSPGQFEYVSPVSHIPLPHAGGQSLSFDELHPVGQQPSLFMQVVIGVWVQAALQAPGLVHASAVHATPSLHAGSFGELHNGEH
jgi:hypothetical protein